MSRFTYAHYSFGLLQLHQGQNGEFWIGRVGCHAMLPIQQLQEMSHTVVFMNVCAHGDPSCPAADFRQSANLSNSVPTVSSVHWCSPCMALHYSVLECSAAHRFQIMCQTHCSYKHFSKQPSIVIHDQAAKCSGYCGREKLVLHSHCTCPQRPLALVAIFQTISTHICSRLWVQVASVGDSAGQGMLIFHLGVDAGHGNDAVFLGWPY
ncbi:unnamed protein product [Ostreobium quekettii]|uniref:Uncharacterized protein n=1 Tax=Ostreobium quekettii TaxID=121088 RepID=A0A8S1JFR5_9CHLO|nr:unnamed protein product [Ostreobium quekettii]|eukprot:evm.model.scf_284.2 EVM.evm.TU.scf_284.2   scf_284:98919-99542(+)